MKNKSENQIIKVTFEGNMKTYFYIKFMTYISEKLKKIAEKKQNIISNKEKTNISFQLKAVKLGEEIKYFRIRKE